MGGVDGDIKKTTPTFVTLTLLLDIVIPEARKVIRPVILIQPITDKPTIPQIIIHKPFDLGFSVKLTLLLSFISKYPFFICKDND